MQSRESWKKSFVEKFRECLNLNNEKLMIDTLNELSNVRNDQRRTVTFNKDNLNIVLNDLDKPNSKYTIDNRFKKTLIRAGFDKSELDSLKTSDILKYETAIFFATSYDLSDQYLNAISENQGAFEKELIKLAKPIIQELEKQKKAQERKDKMEQEKIKAQMEEVPPEPIEVIRMHKKKVKKDKKKEEVAKEETAETATNTLVSRTQDENYQKEDRRSEKDNIPAVFAESKIEETLVETNPQDEVEWQPLSKNVNNPFEEFTLNLTGTPEALKDNSEPVDAETNLDDGKPFNFNLYFEEMKKEMEKMETITEQRKKENVAIAKIAKRQRAMEKMETKEREIEERQREIASLEKEIEKMESEIAPLEKEIETRQREITLVEKENEAREKEIAATRKENEKIEKEIASVEKGNENIEKENKERQMNIKKKEETVEVIPKAKKTKTPKRGRAENNNQTSASKVQDERSREAQLREQEWKKQERSNRRQHAYWESLKNVSERELQRNEEKNRKKYKEIENLAHASENHYKVAETPANVTTNVTTANDESNPREEWGKIENLEPMPKGFLKNVELALAWVGITIRTIGKMIAKTRTDTSVLVKQSIFKPKQFILRRWKRKSSVFPTGKGNSQINDQPAITGPKK